ncbi:uncharacterized protein RNJ42_03672 [Nakaseomyces bracarensis]
MTSLSNSNTEGRGEEATTSRDITMLSGTSSSNGGKTSSMSTSNPASAQSHISSQSNIISQDYTGTATKNKFNWIALFIIALFLI